jgi:hypothetical protein
MDNRPGWVPKVEAALARGEAANEEALSLIIGAAAALARGWEANKEAIGIIAQELAADPKLTQVQVAEYLRRSTTWVSRVLKWGRDGYAPEGPFAAEIAARRAAAKIATSQSQPWLSDYETGEVVIDGSPEPNSAVILGARQSCQGFVEALASVGPEAIRGAFAGSITKRREVLESLAKGLRESIAAAQGVLDKIELVLPEVWPPPEFDDRFVPQDAEADAWEDVDVF